jgi:hypothetical protein
MLDIFRPENPQWNLTVRATHGYDFYHLAEYHRLEQSGEPLLFVSTCGHETIALPFLLRRIDGTDFNDITSVYGYAGPIANSPAPSTAAIDNFYSDLLRFFDRHRVVSAFARLHPLIGYQETTLQRLGATVAHGQSVCIDLSQPATEQRRQYSHSLKNIVNRLRKKEIFTVEPAQTPEEIDIFAAIYRENMQRVKASPMYFFDNNYFHRLIANIPSTLFLARTEDKIVCGSLFTECDGIIQPHLSATCSNFLHLSPLKLVWDEIRIYGVRKGMQFMHLGGGVGSRDDSLFDFKAQFSHNRLTFKTWRYVHNEREYVRLSGKCSVNGRRDTGFFPEYRVFSPL